MSFLHELLNIMPLVNKVSLYIKSKYSFLINAMHKAESGWPFLATGQFMLLMFADFGPFWSILDHPKSGHSKPIARWPNFSFEFNPTQP